MLTERPLVGESSAQGQESADQWDEGEGSPGALRAFPPGPAELQLQRDVQHQLRVKDV